MSAQAQFILLRTGPNTTDIVNTAFIRKIEEDKASGNCRVHMPGGDFIALISFSALHEKLKTSGVMV